MSGDGSGDGSSEGWRVARGHYSNAYMDKSKPVGDACREDGTLKDASEMDWPELPTELEHNLNLTLIEDQFPNNESEEWPTLTESKSDEAPKAKVRLYTSVGSFLWDLLRHILTSERTVNRSLIPSLMAQSQCQNT